MRDTCWIVAGFGGTPDEIGRLYDLGPAAAVTSLVNFDANPPGDLPVFRESPIYDPTLRDFPRRGQPPPGSPPRPAGRWASASNRTDRGGCSQLSTASSTGCGRRNLETRRSPTGGRNAWSRPSARSREDGAVLARPFRHRRGEGPRLPQDGAAARAASTPGDRQFSRRC